MTDINVDSAQLRRLLDYAWDQCEALHESFEENPELFESEEDQQTAIDGVLADMEAIKELDAVIGAPDDEESKS